MGDEERERRERARRLREEIEELKSGAPPTRPRSPREFTERATADESDPPANEHEATEPTDNAST
jgi:hypothetical protein